MRYDDAVPGRALELEQAIGRLNDSPLGFAQPPMKPHVALLLLSLLPLAAVAQQPLGTESATPLVDRLLATDLDRGDDLAGAPVLPIWSGADGKLLAVVALPPGWTAPGQPLSPTPFGAVTWGPVGSQTVGGGITLQFASGLHLDTLLGRYLPTLAPCAGGDCIVPAAPVAEMASGVLGMGWTSPQGTIDLSYGLSWLKSTLPLTAPDGGFDLLSPPEVGAGLGLLPRLVDERSAMFARGRWRFDQDSALDLTASYARLHGSRMAGAALPDVDLDQLSLSLGLDVGSLRGAIVGHVLRSDDPLLAGRRWTTLDLGISWRTPWAGELSVGAQNLLAKPASAPRDGDGQARTPYIQYRQDL